jgi:O-antigen ligase
VLDPFNAPKAALLRILGLALLVWALGEMLLARMGRAEAAPAPAEPQPLDGRIGRFMDAGVAAWVAAGILSLLLGASPRLGVLGEIGQREGVLTTLALAGLYAGTRRSHAAARDARVTLSVVLACAGIAAAYAVLQFAGLDPLAWANAPTYAAAGAAVRRAFGTLGNPILLGSLLAAALAAGVARLACAREGAWRLAAPVVLIACATAATLSRGAWLAAAVGVAAAIGGAVTLRRAHAARRAGIAFAAVAVPAGLWLLIALRGAIAARVGESAGAVSGSARIEIARGALALWRAHPLFGAGPDGFGLLFPGVQPPAFWSAEWLGLPLHAHSEALQVLATLGVAGALAGLAWLAVLAWALTGTRDPHADPGETVALRAALAALVAAGAFNPVGLAGAACFAVFSALAVATGEERAAKPNRARLEVMERRLRTPRLAARAACFVTAAVALFYAAREMNALSAAGVARAALERAAGEKQPAARDNLAAAAVQQSLRAATGAPGEDELWRLACDASLALGQAAMDRKAGSTAGLAGRSAQAAAGRALTLEPRRASNYQRLGNALTLRANLLEVSAEGLEEQLRRGPEVAALTDSADAAFAAAEKLAPADGLVLTDHVRAQLMLGRATQALATAQRITALYPGAASGHALVAAALIALDRRPDARVALMRANAAHWEEGTETQRKAVERLIREYAHPDTAQ